MKLFIVFFMIIINTAIISTQPLTTNYSEDIHKELILLAKNGHLRNIQSMNAVLMKYVNSKFRHLQKHRQRKIWTILVEKIRNIVSSKIRKEPSKDYWIAKGDRLARMLKWGWQGIAMRRFYWQATSRFRFDGRTWIMKRQKKKLIVYSMLQKRKKDIKNVWNILTLLRKIAFVALFYDPINNCHLDSTHCFIKFCTILIKYISVLWTLEMKFDIWCVMSVNSSTV